MKALQTFLCLCLAFQTISAQDCIPTQSNQVIETCDEYSTPDGTVYTSSGVYSYILTNAGGCDSTVYFDLTINPSYIYTTCDIACSQFVSQDGDVYQYDTTFTNHYYTYNYGCDSIITFEITILLPSSSSSIISHNCGSYTAPDGSLYTTSGTHSFTLTNWLGCDSIVSLDLQLTGSNDSTFYFLSFCDEIELADGTILMGDTIIQEQFTNTSGCDSIVFYHLEQISSSSSNSIQIACDSYTDPNGTIYTSSGNYIYYLTNNVGCDSIINLELTLHPSYSYEVTLDICDTYTAPDGSIITQDTVIIDHQISNSGCDSITTINVTISESTSSTLNQIACESYVLNDGTVITESGTYTASYIDNNGCDSTIVLELTIIDIDESISLNEMTLSANQSNANYQWVDCDNNNEPIMNATQQNYTPTTDGNYAVIITMQGCEKVSDCAEISIVNNDEIFENNLSVFPNPTSGDLYINLAERYDYTTVSLFNALGQLTQSKIYRNQSNIKYRLNGVPGLYLLVIENEDGERAEFKILKD